MLEIIVPETEFYNEKTGNFIKADKQILKLEHSLISISKWESKWKKPFLTEETKTKQEILSYIECMSISPLCDKSVIFRLTESNYNDITEYISDSMTATWFSKSKPTSKRDIMTSEVIYAQMIGLGIPVEFEKWHIHRLMTLIKVCDILFNKDSKKNLMSQKEILKSNRELNEARRKKLNTKG